MILPFVMLALSPHHLPALDDWFRPRFAEYIMFSFIVIISLLPLRQYHFIITRHIYAHYGYAALFTAYRACCLRQSRYEKMFATTTLELCYAIMPSHV